MRADTEARFKTLVSDFERSVSLHYPELRAGVLAKRNERGQMMYAIGVINQRDTSYTRMTCYGSVGQVETSFIANMFDKYYSAYRTFINIRRQEGRPTR